MTRDRWQTDLPHEPGDWLWIYQWGCGCCLISHGIVWVTLKSRSPAEDDSDRHFDYTEAGTELRMHYEGNEKAPDFFDGKPAVSWWQKLTLPPSPEDVLPAPPDGTEKP
jgi:hypothetical protein